MGDNNSSNTHQTDSSDSSDSIPDLPQELIEGISHGAAILDSEFKKHLNQSPTEEEKYEVIDKISS